VTADPIVVPGPLARRPCVFVGIFLRPVGLIDSFARSCWCSYNDRLKAAISLYLLPRAECRCRQARAAEALCTGLVDRHHCHHALTLAHSRLKRTEPNVRLGSSASVRRCQRHVALPPIATELMRRSEHRKRPQAVIQSYFTFPFCSTLPARNQT
jgi:hypothetical protein